MESEWTAEPWRVLELEGTRFGPSFGILSPPPGPGRIDSQISGMSKENATRIVQCVNSMASIPDPMEFREAAVACRDRLIHALAYIRDFRPNEYLDQHLSEAITRLSKAMGEK